MNVIARSGVVPVEIFLKTGGLTLTMLAAGHTFGLSFICREFKC